MMRLLQSFPRLSTWMRSATGRILHKPDIIIPKETLGTIYGSHTIPAGLLNESSVVYSAGIGTDVSFDQEVIRRFGCEVHGFDPTPRSTLWVDNQQLDKRFHFHALGFSRRDAEVPFQPPQNDEHVSFTAAQPDSGGLMLPVRRLTTIMHDLGHHHVDLLKMDIEGFEYDVLPDMIECRIFPRAIAVEFHHRMHHFSDDDTKNAVQALVSAGYGLFHVSPTGREYSFIHRQARPN